MERLGQIVVRARVEPRHLLAPGPARGQDQDGSSLAVAAPALQHRDAVDLGQAQVEDHRVVRLGVAKEMRLLAVGGVVDGVVGVGQGLFQLPRQVRIVFRQQDPHGSALLYLPST
jgi:hypothetical protein